MKKVENNVNDLRSLYMLKLSEYKSYKKEIERMLQEGKDNGSNIHILCNSCLNILDMYSCNIPTYEVENLKKAINAIKDIVTGGK